MPAAVKMKDDSRPVVPSESVSSGLCLERLEQDKSIVHCYSRKRDGLQQARM